MNANTPFLLIIEAAEGLNTHSVYSTLEEATKSKERAFKKNQEPICIYDLHSQKFVWENESFPPYGETISNGIIQSYLK